MSQRPTSSVIEPAVPRSIPLLALRGVSKSFGPTHALVDVDLDLGRGEIVALMGANGAGKSTLVSILGGFTRPDGGRITLEGRPLAVGSPSESSRSGIAVVHQATDRAGVPGLTVADALVLVIGETAIIGNRVRLYQAVTLGAKSFLADENGVLIKGESRHPVVEDDVVIYAGATVLGRVTIGAGSVIGGNVWLTQNVPPRSSITQATLRRAETPPG